MRDWRKECFAFRCTITANNDQQHQALTYFIYASSQLSHRFHTQRCSLLNNTPDGLNHWGCCAPLDGLTVFSSLQKVLPATVVGLFVENPGSLLDFAGMDFPGMKLIHDRRAVIHEFMHLATKLTLLKELNLVFAWAGLEWNKRVHGLLRSSAEKFICNV